MADAPTSDMSNDDASGDIDPDKFVPNYKARCEVCGQSPTVEGVKDGKVVYGSDMCGPCTFGESACLDPEEWNK